MHQNKNHMHTNLGVIRDRKKGGGQGIEGWEIIQQKFRVLSSENTWFLLFWKMQLLPRWRIVKESLGEYSEEKITRHLEDDCT